MALNIFKILSAGIGKITGKGPRSRSSGAVSSGSISLEDTFQSSPVRAQPPSVSSKLRRTPEEAVIFSGKYNRDLNLSPESISKKNEKMKKNPLKFYRMLPALFHRDLNGPYANQAWLLDEPAPHVTVCGDIHIGNYGTFRPPKGNPVWGMNDFDQSGKASPEGDLERLACSATLLAREKGLSNEDQVSMVKEIGREYLKTVHDTAKGKPVHPPFLSKGEARGLVDVQLAISGSQTRKDLLEKYATMENGAYKFNHHKLQPLNEQEKSQVKAGLDEFEKALPNNINVAKPLVVMDMARKTGSGGSSLGLDRFYVLLAAKNPERLPVILELKQFPPCPVDSQDGNLERCDADLVVLNQKQMGGYANPLTGSTTINGMSYYVREREPEKSSIDLDAVNDKGKLKELCKYSARVLAYSHARDRVQARLIDNWAGRDYRRLIDNLVDFSTTYATQVEADYNAFCEAHPEQQPPY